MLFSRRIVTTVFMAYTAILTASEERSPGEYVYTKEFYVLADDSLEFSQDGKFLVARRYDGPTGYNKKNAVIAVDSGFAVEMDDNAVALLLKDKTSDPVVIFDPLIYYFNARYFQRMFSCPYLIGGQRIEEIGKNPELRAIARTPDRNRIAIGFNQPAKIVLYTFHSYSR